MFLLLNYFVQTSGLEKKSPKFEGVLEINSILTQTERLFEGQLLGPESIAADSTGDQTLELIFCSIIYIENATVILILHIK